MDNNALNLLFQNIIQTFKKEMLIKNVLMNDFKYNKKLFKNIHCIILLYIYCGIEHINAILNDKNKKSPDINGYLNYNEIKSILCKFFNNEQCHNNENKIQICILCSKFNKNKDSYLNNNRKSSLNINEKKVFNNNRKNLKNKLKIKKSVNNLFGSDISLKLVKSNITNKNINNNKNIFNNSNDKRLLNYLKTTIEDKYINNLNSHRDFEVNNKDIIISKNKNKCNNNKSANKIFNYSYKHNIININNKSNIKQNSNLQNFFSGKHKNKSKNNNSNININNNQQIFFYPKVEQYLNNVYIINDNKSINSKANNENSITNNNEQKNINEKDINILNNMEIINKQINSMENIFNNFKAQTMEIRKQMMEIGKK